jgi:hypothetical protein
MITAREKALNKISKKPSSPFAMIERKAVRQQITKSPLTALQGMMRCLFLILSLDISWEDRLI